MAIWTSWSQWLIGSHSADQLEHGRHSAAIHMIMHTTGMHDIILLRLVLLVYMQYVGFHDTGCEAFQYKLLLLIIIMDISIVHDP